ncbi:hypothetical protein Aperf_G00000063729 [Anoplocephala perfoliata]
MALFKGLLNSVFRRRQKSATETLEDIDANINLLKEHKALKVSSANKITFQLVFYAALPYVTFLVVYFFLVRPTSTHWRVVFITGLVLYPLVVWLLKYLIDIIYLGSASRADKKLKDLLRQKRQVLENVMNTETYNKAQQILKRFDPMGLIVRESFMDRSVVNMEMETAAKQRTKASNANSHPTLKSSPAATQTPTNLDPLPTAQTVSPLSSKGPITHRPILPRERSILDIVVDAIVGDGPNRRYALICQHCAGHNGMALAEEFEYLAFRCCYCGFHNPARRIRRYPHSTNFPTSPNSLSAQKTPLSSLHLQSSSALNLTSVGSRSYLNHSPFERISLSTDNVASPSFIETLPPMESKRRRKAKRKSESRSASACSLVTPALPEEEEEEKEVENSI